MKRNGEIEMLKGAKKQNVKGTSKYTCIMNFKIEIEKER